MLPRFLFYGCAGWVLEVCFTGTSSAIFQKDSHGTAKTYLWMHPIYGATALGLELLHDRLRPLPRPLRALAYTAAIFGAEYTTGWLLRRALGRCPWDYTQRGWNVKGLVRLDYFPFWYGAALLFEPAREALRALEATLQGALAPEQAESDSEIPLGAEALPSPVG